LGVRIGEGGKHRLMRLSRSHTLAIFPEEARFYAEREPT